jgi:hypothetical protein
MSNGRGRPSTAPAIGESFDEVVLPHLDAAYRLAHWVMRNEHDAEAALDHELKPPRNAARTDVREQEADAVLV